ncbi:MAG: DEAD/DEAH box helicase [Candidatus Heimdallarchaeota archaeon]|nr:DEAD/DEAH box helicase [Candidatus Heimdallarchaeota archaeon]MCK5048779.1 DEAD/DEAH box helicase [Candidatus Heimdallarchaeota archaeon]
MPDDKKKEFVTHPLIKPNAIEARLYQQTLVGSSLFQNTLVVLPTGLGKTIIFIMMAAFRLAKHPDSYVIITAPTRPLIEQHSETCKALMDILEDEVVVLTGSTPPEKRKKIWDRGKIFVCTPQTLLNDVVNNLVDISKCSFLCLDEVHRAVGEYAYVPIAEIYHTKANNPLILGITASPGKNQAKIQEIMENTHITHIESRDEGSGDVSPYVHDIEELWLKVQLPESFKEVLRLLRETIKSCLIILKEAGVIDSVQLNKNPRRELINLPGKIKEMADNEELEREHYFSALGAAGASNRISYMIELIETQGVTGLHTYLSKLASDIENKKSSRFMSRLFASDDMVAVVDLVNGLHSSGLIHPKLDILKEEVLKELETNPPSRILIFAQYRNTVKTISKKLAELEGVRPHWFVGQATSKKDKGLKQKEQIEIINQFKDGIYNALISTSVAEEGLDIGECDLVIFYDIVPSETRTIQRRGRTGRRRTGKVILLMASGTRDEAYYYAAKNRRQQMKRTIKKLSKEPVINEKQQSLDSFIEEKSSKEAKEEKSKSKAKTEKPVEKAKEANNLSEENEISFKTSYEILESKEEESSTLEDKEEQDESEEIKIKIIMDHREKQSSITKELFMLDVDIQAVQLETADYVLSNEVAVERKSASDFVKSLIDGYLFENLITLKNTYERPLLIIEGEGLYGEGTSPEAVRGAIAAITVKLGIPTISTKNPKDTAKMLYTIAKREQVERKKRVSISSPTGHLSLTQKQELIVASLPNIDSVLAKRLLTHFETVKDLFNANIDDLRKVKGIGHKLAGEIDKIISYIYEPEE